MLEASGSFRQGAGKGLLGEVTLKPRWKPVIGKAGKDRARRYSMFKGSGAATSLCVLNDEKWEGTIPGGRGFSE